MIDRNKHFLRLTDWSEEKVLETIEIASRLKAEVHAGKVSDRLHGQNIAMFFEKPSLRTITTFQVGMNQLGGHAVLLSPDSIGLGKRESVKDVARCLSRWVNAIVVRCFKQQLVEELAEYGSIPVVNALTDDYHPCQAIAFAQMIKENLGGFKNADDMRAQYADGMIDAVYMNGDYYGIPLELTNWCIFLDKPILCPKIEEAEAGLKKHGCQYRVFHDPKEAVKDADILYSDVWVSMGQEGEKATKQSHFLPFQINDELLKLAPSHCKVSHCLPAHRGEEITDSVMDNLDVNMSFEEAENRLHAHKAVLWQVMTPFNK